MRFDQIDINPAAAARIGHAQVVKRIRAAPGRIGQPAFHQERRACYAITHVTAPTHPLCQGNLAEHG